MPTVTASSIINRVAKTLQDDTNVRWTRIELLDYLNDGQREIVLRKPNAYVRTTAMPLAAGTRQTLPVVDGITPIDPIQLLDAPRNTTGRAVRLVMREILDAQNPDWHTMTQTVVVQHFCFTESDPKHFWVYPPNTGGGCLDIIYSSSPPNVVLESSPTVIDDIYQAALIDYCIYRAYSKDAEYAADPTRANAHYAAFSASLAGKSTLEAAGSPNTLSMANPNGPRAK